MKIIEIKWKFVKILITNFATRELFEIFEPIFWIISTGLNVEIQSGAQISGPEWGPMQPELDLRDHTGVPQDSSNTSIIK